MESECWVHESVEDNEGNANDSISEKLGSTSESKVQTNGSCRVAENSDNNEVNPKGGEGSGNLELKPDASSPSPARKGLGLKKWRRFRRDANRDGDSSNDAVHMVAQDSPRAGPKPSKRMQYSDRKQQSEGSVSSTNAVVTSFDDPNLGLSPSLAAGTDSENSEDRSSKSSTAASQPKMKYEIPVIGGFPRDKSKITLNGKNSAHALQFGQHGKGWLETGKKARGERVKIEKENSHSSMESDSRSSNFVFVQGTFCMNNGIQSEGTNEYDGENGDEVKGSGKQVNDGDGGGYGKDGEGGFEDLSPEDAGADSSWVDKEERSEKHGPMRDKDPLAESMRALQSVQEALQQEVLKFKEIGNDVSVDGPVSDLCNGFTDVEQKLQETSGEGSQNNSQSKVVQSGERDVVAELEDLFKQKVEAEVEYLTISTALQKLRVAAVDQITVLEEQKGLAEKLDNFCDGADEMQKLKKGACKYASCFVLQLVLLFVFAVFVLQFSQDYVEVVPT